MEHVLSTHKMKNMSINQNWNQSRLKISLNIIHKLFHRN